MAIQLDDVDITYTYLLILGPSGSSKTSLINNVRGNMSLCEQETTTEVTLNQAMIGERNYVLVDTPGLDNPHISDYQVFKQIKEYLVTEEAEHNALAGVIYIHRLGDSLKSGTLHRNMRVISHDFLGTSWYPRLTILVSPDSKTQDLDSRVEAMSRPDSPFFDALSGGARVLSTIEETQIHRVLEFYASTTPALLQIQTTCDLVPSEFIGDSIERRLGYLDIHSAKLHLGVQAEQIDYSHQAELEKFRSKLARSKIRNSDLSDRLEQLETELVLYHEEEISLRHQLEQTQAEYASLRSQLQLQENIELADIVRALESLNREIENIGRSFSAFLVDNHAVRLLGYQPADLTTLHACHLPQLKGFLGHEGGPSLVASSQGQGLGIEDFFDYSIRSMLCNYLHERLFHPFHPGAEGSESISLGTMYNNIRRREPQTVAAKWRSASFKSIYKHNDPAETSRRIQKITQSIIRTGLTPLTDFFFGKQYNATFEEHHYVQLERLVRTAWEWNIMLKGEVLVLGDFTQTNYHAGSCFNPQLMIEYDTRPGGPKPCTVLATLALGLDSSRAVGGGRPPKITNVCKAIIATESTLYG